MTTLKTPPQPADPVEMDMQLFWQKSRAGQAVLFSLFSALIGVNLFADLPLGINVLCFALLVLLGFIGMRVIQHKKISKIDSGLMVLGVFFCANLVWRESMVLNSLTILSLLLLGFVAFSLGKQRHWQAWYLHHSKQDSLAAIKYVSNTPLQLGQSAYQETLSLSQRLCDEKTSEAVARGLMFAIPITVVFAVLFINADARFESTISHLFAWDFGALWSNAGLFIFCFVIAAILQRAAGIKLQHNASIKDQTQSIDNNAVQKTYRIEIGMVLALVNILFLSFVWVQFSYFFGGDTMVQNITGPSYSEYARRGFFQLLIVALLVLLLLLSSHFMFKPSTLRQRHWFQLLAGCLIILTWIIELSAIHRMYLYVQAYGLTELRFYSSMMMVWIACILLWFSLSVLRNQAGSFLVGAVLSVFLSVASLHIINPDATIMRTNLDRLAAGQDLDIRYINHLSADMIPTVAQRLSVLQQNKANRPLICDLSTVLKHIASSHVNQQHWLAWHWARHQSNQLLGKINNFQLACEKTVE